ncbi:MAG: hypothetical protein QW179_03745 [Candidatus Hadarchaeales archaeon]
MKKSGNQRAQVASEYLLLLAVVLIVVGAIASMIFLASWSLGRTTSSDIENVVENIVITPLLR